MFLLETPRLLMRELRTADLPDLRRLLQNPQVMYAYEGPLTDQEMDEWFERQRRRYRDDGFGLWALIEIASQHVALRLGMTHTETIIRHYRGIDMPHYLFRIDCPKASSHEQPGMQTRKVSQ